MYNVRWTGDGCSQFDEFKSKMLAELTRIHGTSVRQLWENWLYRQFVRNKQNAKLCISISHFQYEQRMNSIS